MPGMLFRTARDMLEPRYQLFLEPPDAPQSPAKVERVGRFVGWVPKPSPP